MQIPEARPPFVVFCTHAVEDREASIADGRFVARDVDFVHITPAGSKDCVEREVAEWFPQLERDLAANRIPGQFIDFFKKAYANFKLGLEAPVEGTALSMWPPISPAQLKNCIELGVRSVEDLAAANEELIGRLGMGGRTLSQKASTWLASAKGDGGKISEQLEALRKDNENLKLANEKLQGQLQELVAQVKATKAL